MTCKEKIVRYKCVCESPTWKKKENKPREIDITLFDHNTVPNFWVKLLLYVMLRPSLESPNYYPPRELSGKELHKKLAKPKVFLFTTFLLNIISKLLDYQHSFMRQNLLLKCKIVLSLKITLKYSSSQQFSWILLQSF